LTIISGVNISLEDGAKAKNVFWIVSSKIIFEANGNLIGIAESHLGIKSEVNAKSNASYHAKENSNALK